MDDSSANSEGEVEADQSAVSLAIEAPKGISSSPLPWTLTANNKKVIKAWALICQQMGENAKRCYEWLRAHPTKPINKRCYALMGKHYAGCWAYEVGSGSRIYYKPRHDKMDVLIYYAGPHPSTIPYPPDDI